MTEETGPEIPEPINLETLSATDAPPIVAPENPIIPNHKRSKPRRIPIGDRADTKPAKASKPKSPAPPKRKGQFVTPLTQIYMGVGLSLMPFDAVCANAVMKSAENCAKSVDELAYQNEAVRRAVYALTQTSAVGAVLVAHLPILMAVAMHHVPQVQNMMGNMGAAFAEQVTEEMGGEDSPNV